MGELDPATPVAAAREIADALPEGTARLEVVQGAGHIAWNDAPDRPARRRQAGQGGRLPPGIEVVYRPYQDEQLDR
jgi:pimeloyl-ACP methyl ester carboxylesterase